jgi:hypothetical protein
LASKEEGLTNKADSWFPASFKQTSLANMPSSYLASKPAPNPQQLSGFLTWTKHDFAAIQENSNVIAALAGIDSENELVVIFAPVPIHSPAGDLIAIAGNMNNEKSEPAFIKINEEWISTLKCLLR